MSELPKYVLVRLSHDVGNPTEIKAEYEPNPDVVPVVRCKDCKGGMFARLVDGTLCYYCDLNSRLVDKDWFCADGEKVTE